MSARPSIAVLIACHNRRTKTLACLTALAAQDAAASFHPIVFDDGSTDGTAAAVRKAWPQATILSGPSDAYWAGGMRAAFDHAIAGDFDHYLWLNDDVVLAADAVSRLLAAHRTVADTTRGPILIGGAVADPATGRTAYGGIVRISRRNPLRFARCAPASTGLCTCETLNGNVVLVPRATALAVGSIGAAFRHTLGDLDYGLRVRQAGGWVGLAPGHVGTCAANAVAARWFNPALPLIERWRIVGHPLGFPLRPWLRFARCHGGPFWFIFAPLPYWRLLVPPGLIRKTARLRPRRPAMSDGGLHAPSL